MHYLLGSRQWIGAHAGNLVAALTKGLLAFLTIFGMRHILRRDWLAALGTAILFTLASDEVRDWGVAALERAARDVSCTTAVHICYGYGIKANNDWKKTLGGEWLQYEETFPLLARSAIKNP